MHEEKNIAVFEKLGHLFADKALGRIEEDAFIAAVEPLFKEASAEPIARTLGQNLASWLGSKPLKWSTSLLDSSEAANTAAKNLAKQMGSATYSLPAFGSAKQWLGKKLRAIGRYGDSKALASSGIADELKKSPFVNSRVYDESVIRNAGKAGAPVATAVEDAAAAAPTPINIIMPQPQAPIVQAAPRSMPLGHAALGAATLLGGGALAGKQLAAPQQRPMMGMMPMPMLMPMPMATPM